MAVGLFPGLAGWDDLGMVVLKRQWRPGDSLDAAEKLMVECAASGETLDGTDAPGGRQPRAGAGPSVVVRAEVLCHLLTGADWVAHPKGVRLRRVRIDGFVDLESATVRCPLWLEGCELDEQQPVMLDFASAPLLVLRGCWLGGLAGYNVAVAASLDLQGTVCASPVNLTGARIGGSVKLEDSALASSVVLSGARVDGSMNCHGARLGADEHGNSLICYGTNVRLSVHLGGGFSAAGAVLLSRAEIGGELICRGASLGANKLGDSLAAVGLRVGGAVYLNRGFGADGAVRLTGATIGGQFRCDGASLGSCPDGNSLICDGARSSGSVSLELEDGKPFTSSGAIRMAGAQITGSLSCSGAQVGANTDGSALVADELQVNVAVLLDSGFAASGAVRMAGADITGQLRCRGGQISGTDPEGNSLIAPGMRVGGSAYLDEGFAAAGGIDLSGADIGGSLSLTAAHVGANQSRCALAGDGLRTGRDVLADEGTFGGRIGLIGATVGGSLLGRDMAISADDRQYALVALRLQAGGDVIVDRLTSPGTVLIAGADIGGRFCCRDAVLEGADPDGDALSLNGAKIGGSVILDGLHTTAGAIQLPHASIGGSLHCQGTRLAAGKSGASLHAAQLTVTGALILGKGFAAAGSVSLQGATIGSEMRWEPAAPPGGEVILEGARAGQLTDDWAPGRTLGYWPAGKLRLTGLTYDSFGSGRTATVNQRLEWLRSPYTARGKNAVPPPAAAPGHKSGGGDGPQPAPAATPPPFTTQPYRQLADVYRRAGQTDEAQAVDIAMRRDQRKYGTLAWHEKALNWLLDVTIRYGFRTRRALVAITVLYLGSVLAFWFAQHQGNLIAAVNVQNQALHPTALHCVTGYPCFYPAGYAFDLVVPLINIHQVEFWQPNGHHWLGWAWITGAWTVTALGWGLATLLVVGFSGLARQQ
jgi:hypothetical protein